MHHFCIEKPSRGWFLGPGSLCSMSLGRPRLLAAVQPARHCAGPALRPGHIWRKQPGKLGALGLFWGREVGPHTGCISATQPMTPNSP